MGNSGKKRGNVLYLENSDPFHFIDGGNIGLVKLRSPGVHSSLSDITC